MQDRLTMSMTCYTFYDRDLVLRIERLGVTLMITMHGNIAINKTTSFLVTRNHDVGRRVGYQTTAWT
jgi:hypothetical protein